MAVNLLAPGGAPTGSSRLRELPPACGRGMGREVRRTARHPAPAIRPSVSPCRRDNTDTPGARTRALRRPATYIRTAIGVKELMITALPPLAVRM